MFLGTIDAQPKLTSERNAISLSSVTYRHLDHATNRNLTCDKCPAGTYVSKHCTKTTLRECSPCANGTFTQHENGIERCHLCRKPCELPMVERTRCTTLTDRECVCPPGQFLVNATCLLYSLCPVGWGVRKKGTDTEDIRCKPCPRGTFSDVPSSFLRCRTFTDCSRRNMVVIKPGTKETDNSCGLPSALLNGAGLLSGPEEGEHRYKALAATSLSKGTYKTLTSIWSRVS